MNIIEESTRLIKTFEGCRLTVYRDAAGISTIGWGHAHTTLKSISQEQADNLLNTDILSCYKKITDEMQRISNKIILSDISDKMYVALLSFVFNLGLGNLRKLTDNGNRPIDVWGDKMLLYCNAGGEKLQGLIKRRQAENFIFYGAALEDLYVTKCKQEIYSSAGKRIIPANTTLHLRAVEGDVMLFKSTVIPDKFWLRQGDVERLVSHGK